MEGFFAQFAAFWNALPPGLAAFIVLVFGWLAAAALRFLVTRFLLAVGLDAIGERTGLAEFLRKGNARYTPAHLTGVIVYWLAVLIVLLEVAKILDIGIYHDITGRITAFLPNLVVGTLIAVVGSIIVTFLANFVQTIALNAAVPNARLLARVIRWLGIIIVITIALEQAGLGKSIIDFIFQIVLGAAAFGTALAFGLGCKDLAREFLLRLIRNLHEKERTTKGSDLEG